MLTAAEGNDEHRSYTEVLQWQQRFPGCSVGLWFEHLPFLEHSLLSKTIFEMDPSLCVLQCTDSAYNTLFLKQSSGAVTASAPHHAQACAETCLECTVSESSGIKCENWFLIFNWRKLKLNSSAFHMVSGFTGFLCITKSI